MLVCFKCVHTGSLAVIMDGVLTHGASATTVMTVVTILMSVTVVGHNGIRALSSRSLCL